MDLANSNWCSCNDDFSVLNCFAIVIVSAALPELAAEQSEAVQGYRRCFQIRELPCSAIPSPLLTPYLYHMRICWVHASPHACTPCRVHASPHTCTPCRIHASPHACTPMQRASDDWQKVLTPHAPLIANYLQDILALIHRKGV